MSAPYRNANLLATAALVLGNKLKIVSIHLDNTANAAASYFQMYNAAAAADVTVGTTTPDLSLLVPGGGAMDFDWGNNELELGNGLVIAATTTPGGNTAPSAGLLANIVYDRM